MKLVRVIGNVVATVKDPCFKGHKVLIVQPIDEHGKDVSQSFLSCDTANAGPGDVVLVQQEGNTARELLGTKDDPFHSVIVGVVDKVSALPAAASNRPGSAAAEDAEEA
ncbi:MAG: EutN/CcmL family microcompartment protein [Candidatus Aminicenantes bacterium]|nr:EutN/CcmL family microcompartment protein [Candidatus Aminicenantes bacterium]